MMLTDEDLGPGTAEGASQTSEQLPNDMGPTVLYHRTSVTVLQNSLGSFEKRHNLRRPPAAVEGGSYPWALERHLCTRLGQTRARSC